MRKVPHCSFAIMRTNKVVNDSLFLPFQPHRIPWNTQWQATLHLSPIPTSWVAISKSASRLNYQQYLWYETLHFNLHPTIQSNLPNSSNRGTTAENSRRCMRVWCLAPQRGPSRTLRLRPQPCPTPTHPVASRAAVESVSTSPPSRCRADMTSCTRA